MPKRVNNQLGLGRPGWATYPFASPLVGSTSCTGGAGCRPAAGRARSGLPVEVDGADVRRSDGRGCRRERDGWPGAVLWGPDGGQALGAQGRHCGGGPALHLGRVGSWERGAERAGGGESAAGSVGATARPPAHTSAESPAPAAAAGRARRPLGSRLPRRTRSREAASEAAADEALPSFSGL